MGKIFFDAGRHLSVVVGGRRSNRRISEFASAKGWRGDCHEKVRSLSFCFHRRGNIGIGCGSSPPFRALLAKSVVVGPMYDDKGDGERKEEGKGKKKGREERDTLRKSRTQFDGRKQTVGWKRGEQEPRGGVIQGVPLISPRKIGHEMH